MKTLGRFLLIGSLCFLSACETINVKRDYDQNARFGEYKTYAWGPEPATQSFVDPAVVAAIHAAVDSGFAARGYTNVPGKTPDVYVVYHVTAAQQTDVRHYTDWGVGTAYRSGYGFYSGWPGNPKTYVAIDQYPVGALVLDLVEVRRQQLVWRGVASGVISDKAAENATKAAEAVRLLLAQFPPPPGS
jgi:hypothetical protein